MLIFPIYLQRYEYVITNIKSPARITSSLLPFKGVINVSTWNHIMKTPEHSNSFSGLCLSHSCAPAASLHQALGSCPMKLSPEEKLALSKVWAQWTKAETSQVLEGVPSCLTVFLLGMAVINRNWARRVSDFCACSYKSVDA